VSERAQAASVKLDPAESLRGAAGQARLQLMAIHAGVGAPAAAQGAVIAAATALQGTVDQLSAIKQVCAVLATLAI
jgi:hypothetical protein